MIKEELVEYVTSFLNEENEAEFNLEIDALNSAELFHYHTVKRLHKAYKLFLANDDYLGDFLIAFRDYMITLDVAQEYKGKPIKEPQKLMLRSLSRSRHPPMHQSAFLSELFRSVQ